MLDVRRLRVLREVAACGSFSAAAESLAYTQSAVSQQITALEREAGTTLVERSVRGVRLTDAGRALVQHADAILARLADAEFRDRPPAVELTLEPAEPGPAVAKLRAGEVDVALDITVGFRPLPDDGVDRVHLLDDPMYVALPHGHPAARKRNLKLEDLAEESWILGTTTSCPDASIFLRSCQLAGFEPRIAFNSDDYFAMQGFVAAGVGAAFIPDLALISVREDIVVRSLGARSPARQIVAATLEGSFRSPAKQAMLDVLVEVGQRFAGKHRRLALAS